MDNFQTIFPSNTQSVKILAPIYVKFGGMIRSPVKGQPLKTLFHIVSINSDNLSVLLNLYSRNTLLPISVTVSGIFKYPVN